MHETGKATMRRVRDANFVSRYFRGEGIDIGSGNDPLVNYAEFFPQISNVRSWDKEDGDAQHMRTALMASYDFVHSSHCLEDLDNPAWALKVWCGLLRPGGHLVLLVPDEDLYEQGIFPSTFNPDHKWTFTVFKTKSWSPRSINILTFLANTLLENYEVIKVERLTATYRFKHMDRQDQTLGIAEAAIEIIVRRRCLGEEAIAARPELYGTAPKLKEALAAERDHQKTLQARIKREERPALALHRPGAIGDIILTLNLVPVLQKKYPEHDIHYYCNKEIGMGFARLFQAAGIKKAFPSELLARNYVRYERIFNLIGYPLQEGYPDKPMRKHLLEYFADEMEIDLSRSAIVDIPPRLPFLTNVERAPRDPYLPPRFATIHATAGWSKYKNWPLERWEQVIARCPDIPFIQIGGASDPPLTGVTAYFIGRPLQTAIDVCSHADIHIGVDSFPNHLSHIRWKDKGHTPSVILWGSTQHDAAGYPTNINLSAGLECQPCFREDPKISRMPRGPCVNPLAQSYDEPGHLHECMNAIGVDEVVDAIRKLWGVSTEPEASRSAPSP